MSRIVRSRLDIAFGLELTIGQTWRCQGCGIEWRVRQVHRKECVADLVQVGGPARRTIEFSVLRTSWEQVHPETQQEAA